MKDEHDVQKQLHSLCQHEEEGGKVEVVQNCGYYFASHLRVGCGWVGLWLGGLWLGCGWIVVGLGLGWVVVGLWFGCGWIGLGCGWVKWFSRVD